MIGASSPPLHLIHDGIRWEEKQLLEASRRLGIALHPLPVRALDLAVTREWPRSTFLMRTPSYFRCVQISKILASQGHTTLNSPAVLERCGQKILTDEWLLQHDLPAVQSRLLYSDEHIEACVGELGLPIVLKPNIGGFGKRVQRIERARELRNAWEHIAAFAPVHHRTLYCQRYIEADSEFRALILDGTLVACVHRHHEGSWIRNVARGGSCARREPPGDVLDVLDTLAERVGADFVAVDVIVDTKGRTFVCELNAVCGFREVGAVLERDLASEYLRAIERRVRGGVFDAVPVAALTERHER